MSKCERVVHMKVVEIKDYVGAINELYGEFSKTTDPFDRRRFAAALTIMADQLMLALSPIINDKVISPNITVEDWPKPEGPPPEPFTPQKTAKIYQFKGKE